MTDTLPPPPTAETVTVMFAEITNATALEEAHPARYRELTAQCAPIVRQFVAAHQGALVKSTGDHNFFAVFSRASHALECASELLPHLYMHCWPAVFAQHGWRAALTTGLPYRSGSDYIGPPVNRCARLLEVAAPWQILLTRAVSEQPGEKTPEGISLHDKGERHLRDVDELTHIFEARHALLPQAPTALPPGRSPCPLPALLTTFLGRAEERARLTALLRDPNVRLLTLTGVGGGGKTRLAVETLRELERERPAGVWFIPCSEAMAAQPLIMVLAQALGLAAGQSSLAEARSSVFAFFQERDGLLALDNFDRMVTQAPLLSDLLAAAPGLKCLTTSRECLRLPEETIFAVPPLCSDDALLLFADRARSARADFSLTAPTTPAVQTICEQLNGLPLALELAAPLLRGLSLAQLAARMRQRRLDLVTSARRDFDPRHHTLRRCLEWSHATLSEPERDVFARLGVFSGEFSGEAAQAVCVAEDDLPEEDRARIAMPPCALSDEVKRLLFSLRDKSLLTLSQKDGQIRGALLDMVREFAREKLAANEAMHQETHLRHALHYLRALHGARVRFSTHGVGEYFHLCSLERENIRAGMAWTQNAAGRAGAKIAREKRLFTEYVLLMAVWFIEQNQWETFQSCAMGAVQTLEAEAEWSKLSALRSYIAHLAQRRGDLVTAAQELEHALALREKIEDHRGACETVYNLGVILKDQGNLTAAEARFQETLARAGALGYDLPAACALNDLGELALQRNDLKEAERLLRESRASFEAQNQRLGVACANVNLAHVWIARGEYRTAHACLLETLAIREAIGERYATLDALYQIARLFLSARAVHAAEPLFVFLRDALTEADGALLRRKAEDGLADCERLRKEARTVREKTEKLVISPAASVRTQVVETLGAALAHARNTGYLPLIEPLPVYGVVGRNAAPTVLEAVTVRGVEEAQ